MLPPRYNHWIDELDQIFLPRLGETYCSQQGRYGGQYRACENQRDHDVRAGGIRFEDVSDL